MTRRLAPVAVTLAPVALLLLGFLGRPEDSPWLNRSGLWGEGDPFYDEKDPKFLAHPLLIWRGRPSLSGEGFRYGGRTNAFVHNADGLRDDPIVRPKPAGTVRILCVGDSSTWGLNLRRREESYPDQLEALLNARGTRRYDVVNAGTVGYGSLQALQYLRLHLEDLRPDVVTFYLGNNEPTASGASDRARIAATGGALRALMLRNAFYLLFQKGWLSMRRAEPRLSRDELVRIATGATDAPSLRSKEAFYASVARGSPGEYEANLRDVVALTSAAGVRLVLLKPPSNLIWPRTVAAKIHQVLPPWSPWSPIHVADDYLARADRGEPPAGRPLAGHPHLSWVTEADFSREMRRRGDQLPEAAAVEEHLARAVLDQAGAPVRVCRATHRLGVLAMIRGDLDRASELFDRVERALPACAACSPVELACLQHNQGLLAWQRGREECAFELFAESRRTWPFMWSPDYDERFDRVVRELGVAWIDLPELFAREDPAFRGSALISDNVHPNARGNSVIARAIAARIP